MLAAAGNPPSSSPSVQRGPFLAESGLHFVLGRRMPKFRGLPLPAAVEVNPSCSRLFFQEGAAALKIWHYLPYLLLRGIRGLGLGPSPRAAIPALGCTAVAPSCRCAMRRRSAWHGCGATASL